MPNRILRDWTDSEKIDNLDVNAERFFVRLIMKVDDFGRYTANCKLLKSALFPLKTDIRETDIARWLAACQMSDLIALYSVASKEYVQILNFNQRLRQTIEKYPPPSSGQLFDGQLSVNCQSTVSRESVASQKNDGQLTVNCQSIDGTKRIQNPESRIQNPETLSPSEPADSEFLEYNFIEKNKNSVLEFFKKNPNPKIIEPYIFIWNVFAKENKLSEIKAMSEKRKKKLNVRIREKPFDIIKILSVAKKSDFILSSNWFSFDWIIENQTNYMKVIEGNYSNKEKIQKNERENNWTSSSKTNAAAIGKNIDYGTNV
jgi:hypothetical protein